MHSTSRHSLHKSLESLQPYTTKTNFIFIIGELTQQNPISFSSLEKKQSLICFHLMHEMTLCGGLKLPRSEHRRRPVSVATGIGSQKSLIYMDIEAVVSGKTVNVAHVIPEQYTLKKLWEDVKDVCFDLPVYEVKEVRFEVLLPWEILNMSLKTDLDLQDAFKKLRNKHYSWAMFVIKTELDSKSVLSVQNQKKKTPFDKFSVTQYAEPEVDWSDFAAENEFTLPDLNAETSNAGAGVGVNIDSLDSGDSDEEFDYANEDNWDAGLDDYYSADDSGADSDVGDDENIVSATCNYETNSGGFEFTPDGANIVLKIGQLFKTIDEFRNVVKVFAIKDGFRLKRVKNEKSRVTLNCAAPRCTWRIHASPNWNKKHFQIKTYMPEHTCERNNENYEANSTWIAATYLHLFRSNTQLPIDVLGSELFKNYGIKCCNQRLYRAKNKALELLGQDHKASFTELFRKGFFEGCRQFIGVDGCHLKGLYKGVLLSAVSVDANYGIYPLAMCVVDNENTESWTYFMEKLYEQIGCNGGEGLCFMSDRQKGILNALERVFPHALKSNFRGMPIVRMLEEIRRKIMILIHKRYEQANTWQDELPPLVRRKVIEARVESRTLSVIFDHDKTFEVMEDISKRCVVDLGTKYCDCGEWDVSGLPCKHAMCCIDAMRYNVNDYIHHLLKKTAFKKTYSHQLHPVPDESRWPLLLHDNLLPPLVIRADGRPQTKRKMEAGENKAFKRSSSLRCSKCDQWGHNVRSCKVTERGGKTKKFPKKKVHQDEGESLGSTATAGSVNLSQNSVHGNGM
ncbi:SWIM-type domain-containing protein [Citrus sinensis]|nr:SWIM-type domain-containing protein [Citrus sinensis]